VVVYYRGQRRIGTHIDMKAESTHEASSGSTGFPIAMCLNPT
jgi:hypothetical protein